MHRRVDIRLAWSIHDDVLVLDRELVLDRRRVSDAFARRLNPALRLAELARVQLRGVELVCSGLEGLTRMIAYLTAEVTDKAGEDQDGLLAMIQFSVVDHTVVAVVVVELVPEPLTTHTRSSVRAFTLLLVHYPHRATPVTRMT
jgi:hypothetical protein